MKISVFYTLCSFARSIHPQYFQRLSSDNKHFITRQLLKQGNIWPHNVNIRHFIRNERKITFTWLPNTRHKQWKSSSGVQWGTFGVHPIGCQGTGVTSRNSTLCLPILQLQADHTPGLLLHFSSLEIKYQEKNNPFPCLSVTKIFGSFMTTSEVRINTLLMNFVLFPLKKKSFFPRTGPLTLCKKVIHTQSQFDLYIVLCKKGIWMASPQSQNTDYKNLSVLHILANKGKNVHWLQITLSSY